MVADVVARDLAGGEEDILRLASRHWLRILQPFHRGDSDGLDVQGVFAVRL